MSRGQKSIFKLNFGEKPGLFSYVNQVDRKAKHLHFPRPWQPNSIKDAEIDVAR